LYFFFKVSCCFKRSWYCSLVLVRSLLNCEPLSSIFWTS
jgi:hypothetical protein